MAYKVIILYQLYMPSYFLGTFTEYPYLMEVKLPIIVHYPLSSVRYSFCGNPQKESNLYVVVRSSRAGISIGTPWTS